MPTVVRVASGPGAVISPLVVTYVVSLSFGASVVTGAVATVRSLCVGPASVLSVAGSTVGVNDA